MKKTTFRTCLAALTSLSMLLSPVSALAQTGEPAAQEQQGANRALLVQAINEAETLKAEGKLEGVNALVVEKFNTALASAKAVNDKADATQEEVNDAWLNLAKVIQMLGFKTDKTALYEAIAKAQEVDLVDHYDEGKDELAAAIEHAIEVSESDTALTDQSIQEAIDRLEAAITGLTKVKVIPLYRVYNPNGGEHHYTTVEREYNYLASVGWKAEGIAWYVPEVSNIPVYRVYNPNGGDHHYTTSEREYNYLTSVGWKGEGTGWYSDHKKTTNVHRLYNPNAKVGSHHFTIDQRESDYLASVGWKYEGVAFHGK